MEHHYDWINSIDTYGWIQWYFRYWLGRRSLDDERQIIRWKGIISRFNGKFDGYTISSEIRQILLHWAYELAKSDLL